MTYPEMYDRRALEEHNRKSRETLARLSWAVPAVMLVAFALSAGFIVALEAYFGLHSGPVGQDGIVTLLGANG